MLTYYNTDFTCVPLWEYDDLKVKVRNAYAYATRNAPGADTAAADFADDPAPEITPIGKNREDNFVVLDGMKFSVVRTPRPRRGKKKGQAS